MGGWFSSLQRLRQAGFPVRLITAFRDHAPQTLADELLGRWLAQSWAIPDPAKRPAPQVVADPLPELTSAVMQQMTTFWTSFLQEPESIRTDGPVGASAGGRAPQRTGGVDLDGGYAGAGRASIRRWRPSSKRRG